MFQRPADFFADNMVVCFGLLVAASGCVSGNCGTVPAETVRDVQNQAAYEEMLSEEMTDEALKVVEEYGMGKRKRQRAAAILRSL